jgi:hypothetical protein
LFYQAEKDGRYETVWETTLPGNRPDKTADEYAKNRRARDLKPCEMSAGRLLDVLVLGVRTRGYRAEVTVLLVYAMENFLPSTGKISPGRCFWTLTDTWEYRSDWFFCETKPEPPLAQPTEDDLAIENALLGVLKTQKPGKRDPLIRELVRRSSYAVLDMAHEFTGPETDLLFEEIAQSGDMGWPRELIGLLQSEQPNVREFAGRTLRAVCGEDIGDDYTSWQKWWDENSRNFGICRGIVSVHYGLLASAKEEERRRANNILMKVTGLDACFVADGNKEEILRGQQRWQELLKAARLGE